MLKLRLEQLYESGLIVSTSSDDEISMKKMLEGMSSNLDRLKRTIEGSVDQRAMMNQKFEKLILEKDSGD